MGRSASKPGAYYFAVCVFQLQRHLVVVVVVVGKPMKQVAMHLFFLPQITQRH